MARTKRTKVARPTPTVAAKLARVLGDLIAMYGPPLVARTSSKVLDVLVEATLAQNTSMPNATRGYRTLRREFPRWPLVADAPVEDVQRAIAVCGLSRMRARRLQAMLQRIRDERGTMSLEHLRRVQPSDARAYLASFHGVGPKTTAFVALFALGHPTLPVDNGILRVVRRLGLARPRARDAEVTERLSPAIADGKHLATHVLLFRHAKARCRPTNPKCVDCRLLDECPFGKRRVLHLPPKELIELGLSAVQRRRLLARCISDGLDHRGRSGSR